MSSNFIAAREFFCCFGTWAVRFSRSSGVFSYRFSSVIVCAIFSARPGRSAEEPNIFSFCAFARSIRCIIICRPVCESAGWVVFLPRSRNCRRSKDRILKRWYPWTVFWASIACSAWYVACSGTSSIRD